MLKRAGFFAGLAALVLLVGPGTSNWGQEAKKDPPKKLDDKIKEIAGSAEFLRFVPKHFATLKAVDIAKNQVTLIIEGEELAKVWPLVPDAELKVMGWWGRLADFKVGDRVWAWFKIDRKKQPVAITMLADEISQQDIQGPGLAVESHEGTLLAVKTVQGKTRKVGVAANEPLKSGATVFLQTQEEKARMLLDKKSFEAARDKQKELMRQRWAKDGLPGSVAFVHVFSGEMDLILDHETMRWARSLQVGDKVTLDGQPPIKALVKQVQPWRERTQLRLVVHSFDLADLSPGQRVQLVRTPPPLAVDTDIYPPDIDKPGNRQERIDWFLASIYCTCMVRGDRCTGHFYTLASCNPNACGMPKAMRRTLGEKIDEGKANRQIFDEILKEQGPDLLRPHLLP